MKRCVECGKRLKVGDVQSDNADEGYCQKCLSTMSVNDLVDSLAADQDDILNAFEYYPIRRADR